MTSAISDNTSQQNGSQTKSVVLGASTIASALGLKGAWMSRAELWRVMTGRREVIPTDRMNWGSDNEYRAVAAVECFQGLIYSNTGKAQQSHFRGAKGYTLRATPDGVYTHQNGDIGLLEVKCPQNLHAEVRPYIIAQVQFQAYVCDYTALSESRHELEKEHEGIPLGTAVCDITICEWEFNGTRIWHVEPNPEYIEAALPLVEEFAGYVRDDKEPPRLKKAPVMPDCVVTQVFEELRQDVPF